MICFETGSRAYPLRFTARSLLRACERGQTDVPTLLRGGVWATTLLLYAALCDALPHLTLRQAESLLTVHLESEKKLNALMDKLTRAYDQSGFPADGITRAGFEQLLDTAARAGFARTHTLYDLTYTEIVRELSAFLALNRLRSGQGSSHFMMTDDEMRRALLSMAGRDDHVDA